MAVTISRITKKVDESVTDDDDFEIMYGVLAAMGKSYKATSPLLGLG